MNPIQKLFIILFGLFFTPVMLNSQSNIPQLVSFSAEVRDANNQLLVNTNVSLRLTFREGGQTGNFVYCALHQTTTNANGFLSIQLNRSVLGTGCNGAPSTAFENIPWENGGFWMEVEYQTIPTTPFTNLGQLELAASFYAFAAQTAERLSGFDLSNPNDGDIITYNGVSGQWEAFPPSGVSNNISIDSLDGVDLFNPNNGDVLTYNGSTGTWVALPDSSFSGDYNDLINAPNDVSYFNNDADYSIGPHLDSSDIANMGYVAGPHLDSTDIANMGFVANPITIDSISSNGDTLYLSNGQTFIGASAGAPSTLIPPTITTNSITGITSNSATFSGLIGNANGNVIIERGIVYSAIPNPTINSDKFVLGSGIGTFDTIMSLESNVCCAPQTYFLLSSNTTYYVRAYATTSSNVTFYGNEVNFTTLSIGQTGPGGGIVFFDKGNSTGGWRYLESSLADLGGAVWGCSTNPVNGTEVTVGSGETNTALIVASCNATTFAAKLCDDLVLGGQSDWFLPSRDELHLMNKNLFLNNLGNLDGSGAYWSSSNPQGGSLWNYAFRSTGSYANTGATAINPYYVRAIRAF